MSSICTDNFAVSIILELECDVTVTAADKNKGPYAFGTHTVVVAFAYYIGTDADPTNSNFGFSLMVPALPVGVTVSNITFVPDDLDVTGEINSLKNATVSFNITIVKPADPPDPGQNPPPYTGASRFNFDVDVIVNTGKTP